MPHFVMRPIYFLLSLVNLLLSNECSAAVMQLLNDSFFSNPAELSIINQTQFMLGSLFISPSLHYEGTVNGVSGVADSNVYNTLPYVLTGYRMTDRWVLGLNALPSAYANLEWPMDSFVTPITTRTKALYYRFGVQTSYQLNDDWSFGLGFNVEDNAVDFINFKVPQQGNQINTITGVNYTGDIGIYYKINARTFLTIAGYTKVDTYGRGKSISDTAINPNLSLNITQAPVIFVGLQHTITDKWFLEEKIYWSGWSIAHNINFTNTTSGTYLVPTNWRDVWSFQLSTRYAFKERFAVLGAIIYETNPVPLNTNSIGYPLAAAGSISLGLDITLNKKMSLQSSYTYGAFLPNSPVNNAVSYGLVNAHAQAGLLQISYKT